MQTGGHVHAVFQRPDDGLNPALANHATTVGNTDYQRAYPRLGGFRHFHVRKAQVSVAAVKAKLAEAPVSPPVHDTARGLGGKLVRGIA